MKQKQTGGCQGLEAAGNGENHLNRYRVFFWSDKNVWN